MDISQLERQKIEIAHGAAIADQAEHIWARSTPAGRRRVERLSCFFKDRIIASQACSILEVGIGTGPFMKETVLPDTIFRTGIDISFDLIKQVPGNDPLLIGNIELLPFSASRFDLIYGCSVLHHLDVTRGLQEIYRVLKPSGVLLLSEPNMVNPQIFMQKHIMSLKILLGDVPHETAFSRWTLERQLKDNGFHEIVIQPFDFLHPWTPSFLIDSIAFIGYHAERIPILREIAGSLFIQARKNPSI